MQIDEIRAIRAIATRSIRMQNQASTPAEILVARMFLSSKIKVCSIKSSTRSNALMVLAPDEASLKKLSMGLFEVFTSLLLSLMAYAALLVIR